MAERREFDVIVLGAGAAGLMCAIEAGKRGRKVVVLERAEKPGKKILISGGGRCNFTNIHCKPENFLSSNPHFAKSTLARYTPQDFLSLVEKHGIPYHEKTLGQLFCDRSAQEILTMLLKECEAKGVELVTSVEVTALEHDMLSVPKGSAAGSPGRSPGTTSDSQNQSPIGTDRQCLQRFTVLTNVGDFRSAALVVATGGVSIPKIGATAFGYQLARKFGINIVPTRPGLVPLVLNDAGRNRYGDLSGVSTDVVVKFGRAEFREKMLITHRGLSGPAILQISSYWQDGKPIAIDLAPDKDVTAPMRQSPANRNAQTAKAVFRAALPHRLAERWVDTHEPPRWTNAALEQLERETHGWAVTPAGTEGYDKAEVTVGGVDTDELSAKTLEAKKVPGLYFIGEVVDVTGWLGGYNFQWAWASGAAAGRAV